MMTNRDEMKWEEHKKPENEDDDCHGVTKIIGKKINKIFVDADMELIRFVTDSGEKMDYFTDPDCCSSGWFEHIKGVDLLPFTVKEVHTIMLGEVMPTKSDVDKLYGVKFKIESERYGDEFFIEFRNSSNGYYGSSFRFCDDLPEDKTIIWSELTEDI